MVGAAVAQYVESGENLDLIDAARAGDPEAADYLLAKYQPLINSLVTRADPRYQDDAKDQALLAFSRALNDFRPEHGLSFGNYLKQRIRGDLSTFWRSLESEPDLPDLPREDYLPAGSGRGPQEALEREETMEAVARALDLLEEPMKEIVARYYGLTAEGGGEESVTDIATSFEKSPNWVRWNLNKAHETMAKLPFMRELQAKRRRAYALREAKKVALIFGDPEPALNVPLAGGLPLLQEK